MIIFTQQDFIIGCIFIILVIAPVPEVTHLFGSNWVRDAAASACSRRARAGLWPAGNRPGCAGAALSSGWREEIMGDDGLWLKNGHAKEHRDEPSD